MTPRAGVGWKLWRAARKLQVWRGNPLRAWLAGRDLVPGARLGGLFRYERRVSSQHGEDGVLEALFRVLGPGGRSFVEFGVGDASECNAVRLAREEGWTGLWMDTAGHPSAGPLPIRNEAVTAENIESLMDKYGVPPRFDLLSIDIDGNDYWVWKAVRRRPRVVVVEYNANLGPEARLAVPYDPAFRWDGRTAYYGASLAALAALGEEKGYALVHCESSGTNAFFVEREAAERHFAPGLPAELYRAPVYGPHGRGYPPPGRPLVEV